MILGSSGNGKKLGKMKPSRDQTRGKSSVGGLPVHARKRLFELNARKDDGMSATGKRGNGSNESLNCVAAVDEAIIMV